MARILICDEDAEARGALAGVLVEWGHQVLQAETGDQAIETVQTQEPTVLFIEPELGERDGVDVLKALRQRGYELPVFFVAAKLKSSLVAEAMQHGLKDFMLKPVDSAQLEKKLTEALDNLPESVQEHAAEVHRPTRRWLVVSASERISQALITEIDDDISLQQIEDIDELTELNDDRLVECVVVDAPRGAKLDLLVAGLKDHLPAASLVAVYPHRTPLPAARAWEQGFHLGVTPPFTGPKVGSFIGAKDIETSVLVGDSLIQPHPPAEGDDGLEDYLTNVQSTFLSAVEDLGAACAEYCILDLRWLPQRSASRSVVSEAANRAMHYGVEVIAVGGADVQSFFEATEVTRWVEDLSEWLT